MTPASGDARTAEIGTGQYRLRAEVPDGIFTLAVEADEATARAQHASFTDRCMPLLAPHLPEPARTRQELLQQLWAARQLLAASGLGYLGVLAGELSGRPRLILLGIAAAPLTVPDGINPANMLAVMLRHEYPAAVVEEFPAAQGEGVGIRRRDNLPPPTGISTAVSTIDTGVSQALVPFPQAGLLGTVTGFCFSPDDIDVATIFTATIGYGLTVVA